MASARELGIGIAALLPQPWGGGLCGASMAHRSTANIVDVLDICKRRTHEVFMAIDLRKSQHQPPLTPTQATSVDTKVSLNTQTPPSLLLLTHTESLSSKKCQCCGLRC